MFAVYRPPLDLATKKISLTLTNVPTYFWQSHAHYYSYSATITISPTPLFFAYNLALHIVFVFQSIRCLLWLLVFHHQRTRSNSSQSQTLWRHRLVSGIHSLAFLRSSLEFNSPITNGALLLGTIIGLLCLFCRHSLSPRCGERERISHRGENEWLVALARRVYSRSRLHMCMWARGSRPISVVFVFVFALVGCYRVAAAACGVKFE